MLLLLIVVPCTIVAVTAVLLFDRAGLLSPSKERSSLAPSQFTDAARRGAALSVIVIMSAWILVWLVALAVGLKIIIGSN